MVGSAGAIGSFSLTISDEKGLASAPATVAVTVQNVNHAPVAYAGPNQTVSAKDTVVLNASGSKDPDNDP